MARPKPKGSTAWTREGVEAIIDLVQSREVAPWAEVEARIAHGPWKDFHKVQPVQLNGARQLLRDESPLRVVEEASDHHDHPVITLRVPFKNNKRHIERLRGAKRKLIRRYLSWTNDQDLCGQHAERIVLESIKASQTTAGIWVPDQSIGRIYAVEGVTVEPGPLDAHAYVLDLDTIAKKGNLVVEVKNVRHWLYPWSPEVWQMLVKAARLTAEVDDIAALLAAPHIAWQTFLMAQDIGLLTCPYREQLFHPAIAADQFDEIIDEFGLTISRHEGPHDAIVEWFAGQFRTGPKNQLQPDPSVEWFDRQANRLALVAPVLLQFEDLAGDLDGDARRVRFAQFKVRLEQVSGWELQRGY